MTIEASTTWPAEVRGTMNRVLDRVESALLAAGIRKTARERAVASVMNSLEGETAAVAAGGTSDVAEMEAAVERVAGTPVMTMNTRDWRRQFASWGPRRSRCAMWGAALVVLSLAPLAMLLVAALFFSPHGWRVEAVMRDGHAMVGAPAAEAGTSLLEATGPEGSVTLRSGPHWGQWGAAWLLLPISPLALAGTLLGLLAIGDILLSRGRVKGLPPALFATLFYPVMGVALWWLM